MPVNKFVFVVLLGCFDFLFFWSARKLFRKFRTLDLDAKYWLIDSLLLITVVSIVSVVWDVSHSFSVDEPQYTLMEELEF